jgi:hypothetical protein
VRWDGGQTGGLYRGVIDKHLTFLLLPTTRNCATDHVRRGILMSDPDIDSMSEFEPEDPAVAARLDAEAEADVAAGRVVPHERVREWLMKLARGEREPPPRA